MTDSENPTSPRPTRTEATLPLKQLKVSPARRRAADMEHVVRLALSIMVSGLLQRIGVAVDGTILFGVHRFLAYEHLGRDEIDVVIFENCDSDQIALLEIDENSQRVELSALELGEHLLEREEIWKRRQFCDKLSQKSGRGRPRSFLAATAELMGQNRRSLERAMESARAIVPEARTLLRGTAASDNQSLLKRLAKLPKGQQVVAAQDLRDGKGFSAPKAAIRMPKPERAMSSADETEHPAGLETVHDDLHESRVALETLRALKGLPPAAVPVIDAAVGRLTGVETLVESTLSLSASEPAPAAATASSTASAPSIDAVAIARGRVEQAVEIIAEVCNGDADNQDLYEAARLLALAMSALDGDVSALDTASDVTDEEVAS
jgi:ParB family transcriptional regulator, chromosome partitioning protein